MKSAARRSFSRFAMAAMAAWALAFSAGSAFAAEEEEETAAAFAVNVVTVNGDAKTETNGVMVFALSGADEENNTITFTVITKLFLEVGDEKKEVEDQYSIPFKIEDELSIEQLIDLVCGHVEGVEVTAREIGEPEAAKFDIPGMGLEGIEGALLEYAGEMTREGMKFKETLVMELAKEAPLLGVAAFEYTAESGDMSLKVEGAVVDLKDKDGE